METIVCLCGPSDMTKMATTPIYNDKTLRNSSPAPNGIARFVLVAFRDVGTTKFDQIVTLINVFKCRNLENVIKRLTRLTFQPMSLILDCHQHIHIF